MRRTRGDIGRRRRFAFAAAVLAAADFDAADFAVPLFTVPLFAGAGFADVVRLVVLPDFRTGTLPSAVLWGLASAEDLVAAVFAGGVDVVGAAG